MGKFWNIIKNIFKGIWSVIIAIAKGLQNYMTSTWEKWDREAGIKPRQKKKNTTKKVRKQPKNTTKNVVNLNEFQEFSFKRRKKHGKKK